VAGTEGEVSTTMVVLEGVVIVTLFWATARAIRAEITRPTARRDDFME
jgi:hypothetical protein